MADVWSLWSQKVQELLWKNSKAAGVTGPPSNSVTGRYRSRERRAAYALQTVLVVAPLP
jgi:hypothetical protein